MTHNTVAMNMGYFNSNDKANLKFMFRDKTDNIFYTFLENDGFSYSENKVDDRDFQFNIISTFLKIRAE